jgi:hypothetical protein
MPEETWWNKFVKGVSEVVEYADKVAQQYTASVQQQVITDANYVLTRNSDFDAQQALTGHLNGKYRRMPHLDANQAFQIEAQYRRNVYCQFYVNLSRLQTDDPSHQILIQRAGVLIGTLPIPDIYGNYL